MAPGPHPSSGMLDWLLTTCRTLGNYFVYFELLFPLYTKGNNTYLARAVVGIDDSTRKHR